MMKNCYWPVWAPKSGKKCRPKNQFFQILFLDHNIFSCKKSYQYPNSNSPLFGLIDKKHVGSLSRRYYQFGSVQKVFFLSIWGPKINWFPVLQFGLTFVKNNWWGFWPSCQMMKNWCWPIWAPKSGKSFRPRKRFSKIWFLDRQFFLCKKSNQYPKSNSPLFGPIVEKRVRSFSCRYC